MSLKKINFRKTPFQALFVFSLCFIVFLYIISPSNIVGADSFYHAKISKIIEEQGLIQDFPWTQFTTYNEVFVDHHFGYHKILALFLKIPTPNNLDQSLIELEPILKTKLATAFLAALFFLIFFLFLKKLKIKIPLFWTFLLLTASSFIGRLSLIRAPTISLIFLIIGIYTILKKKYIPLLITSFFYVWFYGAWPLIIITVFIYVLAYSIKHKSFKKLFSSTCLKLILSSVIGIMLGIIINPYFPKTFPFYLFQTIQIAILGTSNVAIGGEWYPPNFLNFLINIFPILLVWLVSISWFIIKKEKQKILEYFFLILSLFFFFYTLKSQRNLDYFIPFTIIFSSIMFSQIIRIANWNKIKSDIGQLFKSKQKEIYSIISIITLFIVSFFSIDYINNGIFQNYKSYQKSENMFHLQNALNWIENNSQEGEIVYHKSWDMFPRLFYFNHKNYYINGLDQNFFYSQNKEKYEIWKKIDQMKINPKNLKEILVKNFNASYIISDKKEGEKFDNFLKKANLKEVYNSPNSSVYSLK